MRLFGRFRDAITLLLFFQLSIFGLVYIWKLSLGHSERFTKVEFAEDIQILAKESNLGLNSVKEYITFVREIRINGNNCDQGYFKMDFNFWTFGCRIGGLKDHESEFTNLKSFTLKAADFDAYTINADYSILKTLLANDSRLGASSEIHFLHMPINPFDSKWLILVPKKILESQ